MILQNITKLHITLSTLHVRKEGKKIVIIYNYYIYYINIQYIIY